MWFPYVEALHHSCNYGRESMTPKKTLVATGIAALVSTGTTLPSAATPAAPSADGSGSVAPSTVREVAPIRNRSLDDLLYLLASESEGLPCQPGQPDCFVFIGSTTQTFEQSLFEASLSDPELRAALEANLPRLIERTQAPDLGRELPEQKQRQALGLAGEATTALRDL